MSVGGPQRQIGDSGRTHFVGDECQPAHEPLVETITASSGLYSTGFTVTEPYEPLCQCGMGEMHRLSKHPRDSTDGEIIDVLLPVQELRAENARLKRKLANKTADCERMWSALEAESTAHVRERGELRADLNRANEHNRALMAEVNQQSKVIEAAREVVSPNTQSRMSALWALSAALESIDKAKPSC